MSWIGRLHREGYSFNCIMAKLKYSRSDVVIAAMCLLIIPQALHCLRTGGTSAGHKSIARGIPCALRLKKAPSRRSRVFMCGNDFTHDPNTGKRPSTWSNIGGNNIIKIADSLWCAERPFVWNGIDVGEEGCRVNVLCFLLGVMLHCNIARRRWKRHSMIQ